MKKLSFVTLLIGLILGGITPTFSQKDNTFYHEVKTYVNPVLPGDHPDPTLLKVGDDFYHCGSSFHFTPYMPIYHSKDLVHWRVISRVLPPQSALGNRPPFGRYLARCDYVFLRFLLDLFLCEWSVV
jgi:hypothetical protein